MSAKYSCSRKTRRWPMFIFYGIVNAAGINAWIIYRKNTRLCQERVKDAQKKFISQLAIDLIRPWAMQCLCIPTLQSHLRSIIKDIFDVKEPANQINRPQELSSRKRCRQCPLGSDNKTSKQCNKCARHCLQGQSFTC